MLPVNFNDEKEVEEYLHIVGTEASYQCYGEKMPDACHRLAEFLYAVKRDYQQALKVFHHACEEYNHADSCYKYGQNRFIGRGVPMDRDDAFKYWSKSCSLGSGKGCLNASRYSSTFKQTPAESVEERVNYLKKGCCLDDKACCGALFEHYIESSDGKLATHYGHLACDGLNSTQACYRLSRLYQFGCDGVKLDLDLAAKYQKKAKHLEATTL